MTFQKKLMLSVSSLMLVASVAACSSNPVPTSTDIKGGADFSQVYSLNSPNVKVVSDSVAKDHIIVDVGNGKKTGASFSVKINLASGNNFKTKSADGVPPKTVAADLQSLKFWLVRSVGAPTGNVGGTFTSAAAVSLDTTTGTHTATFTNVPDNTGGQSYFVAAAAYNVLIAGTQNAASNIDNTTVGTAAPITFGAGNGAYFSTTGGDPGNLGSVKVANFLLSPAGATTDLGVSIKLLDGIGATVTGTTSVNDGTYTGTVGTGAV